MKPILPAAAAPSRRRSQLATAATAADRRCAGAPCRRHRPHRAVLRRLLPCGTDDRDVVRVNFASALVIGVGLAMPVHRIVRSSADRILTVLAISGIGIGAGTLAGLLISENGGLSASQKSAIGERSCCRSCSTPLPSSCWARSSCCDRYSTGTQTWRPRVGSRRPPTVSTCRACWPWARAVVAVVIAGCGGGGGANGSSASTASSAGGGATLRVTTDPTLGRIIVDAKGRTLYDFPIDKGTERCYGACASLWPPVHDARPARRGAGVSAGLIGTSKRHDGTTEVTYAGHPLYDYAPDQARGQITGQALDQFGAPWYALAPSGREIHTPAD